MRDFLYSGLLRDLMNIAPSWTIEDDIEEIKAQLNTEISLNMNGISNSSIGACLEVL